MKMTWSWLKVKPEPLPITAFVLVGGIGARLREVVSDRPKPMALVGGIPFLAILIDLLVGKGVRDFVLLTGFQGEMIERYFADRFAGEINVRICREKEPLGTGGAVKNAEKHATDPTLMVYGDTYLDADLADLYRFHRSRKADVTLSLRPVKDVNRYGAVEINEQGLVTGFSEKGQGPGRSGVVSSGFVLLSKGIIDSLPRAQAFPLEKEIFPSIAQSGKMFGRIEECAFYDIGTPESYAAFQDFARRHGLC